MQSEIEATAIEQAEYGMQDYTKELYLHFHSVNYRFYNGSLRIPYIELKRLEAPKHFCGLFIEPMPFIQNQSPRIIIDAGIIEHCTNLDRLIFARDTLLHEVIHLHLWQIGKVSPVKYCHASAFTRECNRIGAALALPLVRRARTHNKLARRKPISSGWPLNCRGAEYLRAYNDIYKHRVNYAAMQMHSTLRNDPVLKVLSESDLSGLITDINTIDSAATEPAINRALLSIVLYMKKIGLPINVTDSITYGNKYAAGNG